MNTISSFLRKIFIYLFLSILIFIILFFSSSYILKKYNSNLFSGVVLDKYKSIKAKKNEGSMRIILMGGSNSIYSIDSKRIEQELKIKVINSGLVYNTGRDYQLKFIQRYTQPNDIVMYLPEFGYYDVNSNLGTNFLYNMLLFQPKIIKVIGRENIISFLRKGFRTILKPIHYLIMRKKFDNEIKRSDFNEYGDLTYHLDKKNEIEKVRRYNIKNIKISNSFIKELEKTEKYLRLKNVKFVVSFPIYSKNQISKKAIKTIDSLKIRNPMFIGNLKKNLFEETMFYDSPYHALQEARHAYTNNLIISLKNAI